MYLPMSLQKNCTLLDKYDGFALKPKKLLNAYKKNPDNLMAQSKFFLRMTNFVTFNHGWKDLSPLQPSSHLDIEMSSDQHALLNPTVRDVQLGAIVDQAFGK